MAIAVKDQRYRGDLAVLWRVENAIERFGLRGYRYEFEEHW
jgi:hypothetical protein